MNNQSHQQDKGLACGAARSDAGLAGIDQRNTQRLRTVYRVARVLVRGDQGLARVHNISDGGLMLSVSLALYLGDRVRVDLSDRCSLTGKVAWHHARRCGVAFYERIDSAAVLKRLFEERRETTSRPMRLNHSKALVVTSSLGLQLVTLRDVSQAGMKVVHDGRFTPGLSVRVRLTSGLERRGVVRWSEDGLAGIALTELLSVEDLGSLRAI